MILLGLSLVSRLFSSRMFLWLFKSWSFVDPRQFLFWWESCISYSLHSEGSGEENASAKRNNICYHSFLFHKRKKLVIKISPLLKEECLETCVLEKEKNQTLYTLVCDHSFFHLKASGGERERCRAFEGLFLKILTQEPSSQLLLKWNQDQEIT